MPDNFSRDDETIELMDNRQLHQRRRRIIPSIGHHGYPSFSRGNDDESNSRATTSHRRGLLVNPFRNNGNNHNWNLLTFFGGVANPTNSTRSTTRSLSPRRKRTQYITRYFESFKIYIYAAVGITLLILGLLRKSRLESHGHAGRPHPMRGHRRSSFHKNHVDSRWTSTTNSNVSHVSIPIIQVVKATMDWHKQQYDQAQQMSQERANTRKQRTRPPPIDLGMISNIHPPKISLLSTPISILTNVTSKSDIASSLDLCGDHAKNASRIYPSHYSKSHALNKNAVVLITGIFSPLGFHLGTQLALKCNVQVMFAVDPLYPTNYLHLLRSQETIAYFFKHIPALQQPVPVAFVGLDRRLTPQEMEPGIFLNTTGEVNNLANAKITHVIHLSSSDPYLYRDFTDDKYKERYENKHSYVTDDRRLGHLFGFRQSVVSMEQLLMGLSKRVKKRAIKFTFISTYAPWKQHDDPTMAEEQGFFASAKLMDELMAQTYGNLKGVSSVAVRLPTVYGPGGRQGSLMYELAEKASFHRNDSRHLNHTINANTTKLNSSKISLLDRIGYKGSGDKDEKDLVFIDDAVDAILAAVQVRGKSSTSTTLDISSGRSVTVKDMVDFIERDMTYTPHKIQITSTIAPIEVMNNSSISNIDLPTDIQNARNSTNRLIQWSPSTSLETGLRRLMSWHLDKNIPYGSSTDLYDMKPNITVVYGNENGIEYLSRKNVKLCAPDDLYCLRGKVIYPCISECASMKQCKASPYDELKSLLWNATEACDTILYTSFIGKVVKALDSNAPNQTSASKGSDGVICSLAFVPKESPLVSLAIGNISKEGFMQMKITDRLNSEKDADRSSRLIKETNGRVMYKGWTLFFLSNASDQNKLDHASLWLAPLSPKRLFHPSVKYAMYLANITTLTPGLDDVLFLTSQMWRSAQPPKRTTQRIGPKNKGNKELLLDEEPERKVGLLVGALRIAPPEHRLSISPYKFNFPWIEARYAMSVEITGHVQKAETLSVQSQREMYERATPYINNPPYRSGYDPMYNYFAYFWAGTRWILHNLQSETSRKLRCDWYREHSLWENEYDQLSFAHVMARREVERKALRRELDDIARDLVNVDPDLDLYTDKSDWHLIIDPYDNKLSLSSDSQTFVEHDGDSRIVEDDKILDAYGEFTNTDELGDEDGVYVRIMTDLWSQFYRSEWKKTTQKLNF